MAQEKEFEEKMAEAARKAEIKVAKEKLNRAFSLTRVAFKTNSMLLTNESKRRLDETARVMNQYPQFSFKIQGHTDSRGRESYNLTLSQQRAEKVKEYLISKGVDANSLTSEGFGSAYPIADNNTKAGRIKNRRVVFEIVE